MRNEDGILAGVRCNTSLTADPMHDAVGPKRSDLTPDPQRNRIEDSRN